MFGGGSKAGTLFLPIFWKYKLKFFSLDISSLLTGFGILKLWSIILPNVILLLQCLCVPDSDFLFFSTIFFNCTFILDSLAGVTMDGYLILNELYVKLFFKQHGLFTFMIVLRICLMFLTSSAIFLDKDFILLLVCWCTLLIFLTVSLSIRCTMGTDTCDFLLLKGY